MARVAVNVKIVKRVAFKKTVLVHHATIVQKDGSNPTKVHRPAPASIGKPWKVAKTVNI
jgi:hypothetical protein